MDGSLSRESRCGKQKQKSAVQPLRTVDTQKRRKTQHREHTGQSTEMTENSNSREETETKGATGSDACARKKKPRTASGRSFLRVYRTKSVMDSSRTESVG